MHETLHRPDESTFRKKRCHRHRRRRVPIDLILNEILIEETFKENISERGKKKKKIMIQGHGLHFASDLHFGTGVIIRYN